MSDIFIIFPVVYTPNYAQGSLRAGLKVPGIEPSSAACKASPIIYSNITAINPTDF